MDMIRTLLAEGWEGYEYTYGLCEVIELRVCMLSDNPLERLIRRSP